MAIAVAGVVVNLRFLEARLEPKPAVIAGIREHRISWFVRNQFLLFLDGR
jgi:hypothetical protein